MTETRVREHGTATLGFITLRLLSDGRPVVIRSNTILTVQAVTRDGEHVASWVGSSGGSFLVRERVEEIREALENTTVGAWSFGTGRGGFALAEGESKAEDDEEETP